MDDRIKEIWENDFMNNKRFYSMSFDPRISKKTQFLFASVVVVFKDQ